MATSKFERACFRALRAMPTTARKPIIKLGTNVRKAQLNKLQTPITITLYVTSRCNAKCKHCFYVRQLNKADPEPTLEQIEKIVKSLRHSLKTLMISGGEPSMRKDLAEICNIFIKHNKTRRITIDTNGILTERILQTIKQIIQQHPKLSLHIQLSLDGPEEIHDLMRGVKGCYSKAVETLRGLERISENNKNLELSIMTTICDLNFDTAESFCEKFAGDHPTVLHKFNILRGARLGTFGLSDSMTSDLDPEISLTKTPEQLGKLFHKITKISSKNKDQLWQRFQELKWEYMVRMLKNRCKLVDCTAQHTFGVIYQNGDVAICEPMKPIGNLVETDYNFHKLWHSSKAAKFKRATKNCFCIHPCNLLDSMGYDANAILSALESL